MILVGGGGGGEELTEMYGILRSPGIAASPISLLSMERVCGRSLKVPIHDQKINQYIEAKNGHKNFDWIFDRVWEIFLSKNTLTQNIDGSNLFDIF